MTIRRPYVPDLILGTGSGLNIVRYSIVLELTAYAKIVVPNTVLGSTVCVKNAVFFSIECAIHQYLLIKSPLYQDLIVKLGLKIQYFIQQETM